MKIFCPACNRETNWTSEEFEGRGKKYEERTCGECGKVKWIREKGETDLKEEPKNTQGGD